MLLVHHQNDTVEGWERATVAFLFSSLSRCVTTSSHRFILVLPPLSSPPRTLSHELQLIFVLGGTATGVLHMAASSTVREPLRLSCTSWPMLGIWGNSCLLRQIKPSIHPDIRISRMGAHTLKNTWHRNATGMRCC